MKRSVLSWIAVLAFSLAITYAILSPSRNRNVENAETRINVIDSIVYDTITYNKPVPVDSVVVCYKTETLPRYRYKDSLEITRDTIVERFVDSVKVSLPITQKEYRDSSYRAWVSGYDVALDSIQVYPKTVYQTTYIKQKRKRWGIGVQAGYGFDYQGKSFVPYVGVGVSYNIFSW